MDTLAQLVKDVGAPTASLSATLRGIGALGGLIRNTGSGIATLSDAARTSKTLAAIETYNEERQEMVRRAIWLAR